MHTELSLLIRAGDFWYVSSKVGKEGGCWLKAKVGEADDKLLPPVSGWEFSDWRGKYQSDPSMVCSREVSAVCREVIVELKGDAEAKHPDCAGSYLPVEGEYHRGRPVGSFDNNFNNYFDVGIQFNEKNLEVSLLMVIKVIVILSD